KRQHVQDQYGKHKAVEHFFSRCLECRLPYQVEHSFHYKCGNKRQCQKFHLKTLADVGNLEKDVQKWHDHSIQHGVDKKDNVQHRAEHKHVPFQTERPPAQRLDNFTTVRFWVRAEHVFRPFSLFLCR